MYEIALAGRAGNHPANAPRLYCPSLIGLTASQADLAIVMPRIDHNRQLRETSCQGQWAAIMACDPFGSEEAFFRDLSALGYTGLANWPSTILLDGEIRRSMATIPATPEQEYAALARAKADGWNTLAFFRSLDLARAAISAGLNWLVLHPGLINPESVGSRDMITAALNRICIAIRNEAPNCKSYLYTSDWHDRAIMPEDLDVDGHVRLEAAQ